MKYIGVKEAAKKWGISDRRVRLMCVEGRIEGAIKLEWSWTIPSDTPKPMDGRATRHMKNRYMRFGKISLDGLDKLKSEKPFSPSFYNSETGHVVLKNNLLYALKRDEIKVRGSQVEDIFNHKLNQSLSLDNTLLISNFIALHEIGFLALKDFNESALNNLFSRFTQGTTVKCAYREAVSNCANADKGPVKTDVQMSVLFSQYEMEWKSLHPVIRAILVYTELVRIAPFERCNNMFALLVFSSLLNSSGFMCVSFDETLIEEVNATFTLINKRGNYQDFCSLVERQLENSYNLINYV